LQQTTWNNAMTNSQVTIGTSVSLGNYEYLILKK
jgi:hypothetical protein